jgi:hypothetical protein
MMDALYEFKEKISDSEYKSQLENLAKLRKIYIGLTPSALFSARLAEEDHTDSEYEDSSDDLLSDSDDESSDGQRDWDLYVVMCRDDHGSDHPCTTLEEVKVMRAKKNMIRDTMEAKKSLLKTLKEHFD